MSSDKREEHQNDPTSSSVPTPVHKTSTSLNQPSPLTGDGGMLEAGNIPSGIPNEKTTPDNSQGGIYPRETTSGPYDAEVDTSLFVATHQIDNMPASSRSNQSPPDGASSLYSTSASAMNSDHFHDNPYLMQQPSLSDTSDAERSLASADKKITINPNINLDIEKLQVALSYLGIDPTPEQRDELHKRLHPDYNNLVSYGEFVRVARELFSLQLQDITPHIEPPPSSHHAQPLYPPSHNQVADENESSARSERLQAEVNTLRAAMLERERVLRQSGEQLAKMGRELDKAEAVQRSLETRLQLAEAAQRAARSTEQDYEDVVRGLEAQLATITMPPLEHPEVQRRLAVLGCQLKKAEVSRKTYEVATNKLLQFAEVVRTSQHNRLAAMSKLERSSPDIDSPGGPRYLSTKASQVIQAVMALLDVDPLPFGWDEAYTKDGLKYYTNHVTQLTSWQHPLTNIQEVMTSRPPPPAAAASASQAKSKPSTYKPG